ncbi:MAG: VapE domain-containing protein, partial [Bacteroidota bacterium]
MKVSVFKNFNQVEANLDLSVILEQIRSGKYKTRILALRELLRQGKTDEYSSAKKSLPAFTPSGLFEGGRKLEFLKEYTALIILDFDDLAQEDLIIANQIAREIEYTYATFISPSSRGLKILVKVFSRPVFHKSAFDQVKAFYEELLHHKVDPSGKDITRLCFFSWDEYLYQNPSATLFQTHINMVEDDIEKVVREIESRATDITASYEDWVKIGFALVDAIGEEGRTYFHRLSRFYQGYKVNECDDQYNKCLKSTKSGVTIATLFYFARDSGIDISNLRTAPEKAIKQTPTDTIAITPDPIPGNVADESQIKKKKRKNQIDTIESYLSNHYQLRYNIVTSKLEIRKLPNFSTNDSYPGYVSPVTCHEHSSFVTRHSSFVPLTDYQENSLLREILKNNLKCSAALLRSILYSDFSGFFDPFRDYFLHLPVWDGQTDFIQQLAETVNTTSQVLWCKCFKKWLVATIAAVLDNKTVNHTAIILSGGQGIGKTTWMLNLCPPELNDYIFSGTINPNNKDTLIHLAECMFINMDELENMNRTEIGAFKEIITKSTIRMRRAYGHHIEAFTRRASFMGSVNSSQFLTDSTGSRR